MFRRTVSSGYSRSRRNPSWHQVLPLLGLWLVDDLYSPGAFHTIACGCRSSAPSQPPVGKGRVRVVGLQHVCEIDDRPSGCRKQSANLFTWGMLPVRNGMSILASGFSAEAAVSMQEVVLHVQDQEGRFSISGPMGAVCISCRPSRGSVSAAPNSSSCHQYKVHAASLPHPLISRQFCPSAHPFPSSDQPDPRSGHSGVRCILIRPLAARRTILGFLHLCF
jgi:hypothetical protein